MNMNVTWVYDKMHADSHVTSLITSETYLLKYYTGAFVTEKPVPTILATSTTGDTKPLHLLTKRKRFFCPTKY